MKRFVILTLAVPISMLHAASHNPTQFLKDISGLPDEGPRIVEHYCAACHAEKPLIPLGAPRVGNKQDWKERLKQGFKALYHHTEDGYGAMPARGGCFECTDQQLKLAIEAILPRK